MKALFLVSALLPTVWCHGHVTSLIMNAKTYTAYLPVKTPDYTADAPSIMRKIDKENPVTDVYSTEVTCGKYAVPINDNGIARVAPVTAGSVMQYYWGGWPHLSPIQTFMAKCDPDCGSFTGSEGQVWFKIAEDGANPLWATQKLVDDGGWWNITVPECLAPGQYLVRHEIIQTDSCARRGLCHIFINCAQVEVIGTGTAVPEEKIALPGGYSPDDPGLLWNVYTQNRTDYVGPGPRAWKCPS